MNLIQAEHASHSVGACVSQTQSIRFIEASLQESNCYKMLQNIKKD